MIRRNAAQYTKNQESLKQHSFTAMRGVDATKAPTQPDTVLNTMNLDIDYDGGLILRKPLCIANTLSDYEYVGYAFDKETRLLISQYDINLNFSKFKFTDIFGITHTLNDFSIPDVFDFSNCKVTNTTTTTLISNVMCALKNIKTVHNITVYNSNTEPEDQYRILKISKEYSSWVLELLTPEINAVNSDGTVDFNLALHNPLAIRDNYYAEVTSTQGILAYRESSNTHGLSLENVETTTTVEQKSTKIINSYKGIMLRCEWYVDNDKHYLKITNVGFSTVHIFSSLKIQVDSSDPLNWVLSEQEPYLLINLSYRYDTVPDSVSVKVQYSAYVYPNNFSVDILTESKSTFEYIESITATSLGSKNYVVLKAFLNKPNPRGLDAGSVILGYWSRSKNGIDWTPIVSVLSNSNPYCVVHKPNINTNELDDTKAIAWERLPCYKFLPWTYEQLITDNIPFIDSPDCLVLPSTSSNLEYTYKFTIISAKTTSNYKEDQLPELVEGVENFYYTADLDNRTYWFKKGTFEPVDLELNNPTPGHMLYWKNSLYSISPDFKNMIYASEPDSAVFPVSRIIDLGTFEGNTVTKLIPWRDYLIAFTENTVHLVKEQEVGFTTKVVNTFIGAPQRDADTCVSTLNGIVFKSGSKLYSITPNVNSGDETIFNVSEISKPIEHILDKFSYNDEYKPFAFTTPEAYYLFVPSKPDEAGNVNTFCLKYNYTLRVWTQYKYPVLLYKYEMLNVSDIRVFSRTADGIVEYYFEKEPDDVGDLQPYGDFLTTEKDSELGYKISPIEFFVDSGQKTDNLSLTKQFVESKIIVATLSNKDNFEMDVQIAIEGNTFNKHVDINTDGALVRSSSDQILTLGTTSNLTENEDTFNTMRQVFLRYSGRGKTIRHIIKGSSLYKFKIYETFYRFKILNVKQ